MHPLSVYDYRKLENDKELVRIILPDNILLHIFAVTFGKEIVAQEPVYHSPHQLLMEWMGKENQKQSAVDEERENEK